MVVTQEVLERRSMQIHLLGALEASVDDREVALGGAKQRAVLAMLALEANHVVTADRLVEGLWGEDPPASAAKMIQNHVWRLRTALRDDGGAGIVTRGAGYELRIDPDSVDAGRFERLIVAAGHAAAAGEASGAAREALALWRGQPLTDVMAEPFAAAEIRRLEDLRVQATELAIDADLAAGATKRSSVRSSASSATTLSASTCMPSACWRCTAAAVRPRRSRRSAKPAASSSTRSASNRAPSCSPSRTPSSARNRRSSSSRGGRATAGARSRRSLADRGARRRAGLASRALGARA